MIDYALLQALAAVVAQQGFEKAAQKLCLTQSAVSRRIRQLEAQLGEPVLLRSLPPKATAAGQRLLNHLQQVLQLEATLGLGQGVAGSAPLTVRLTTNADSLATWLPQALALPVDSPHRLQFELLVEDQSVGLRRMKSGEVMVCICDAAEPVNGGRVSPLGALRYRAVASPALVARYQLSQPADENAQAGWARRLAAAPCLVFNADDRLQHQYLAEVAEASPEWLHSCPSSEGFRQALLAGLGFGLLPELQLGDLLQSGQLVELTPGYQLDTPLYWHYWQTESPQLRDLRQHALAVAAQLLVV